MEYAYLKDIRFIYPLFFDSSNPVVHEWQFLEFDGGRLYFLPNDNDLGGFRFMALCIEFCIEPNWNIEETQVSCFYHGIALFDGVRHLYCTGYSNNPCIAQHSAFFQALQKLVESFCQTEFVDYLKIAKPEYFIK